MSESQKNDSNRLTWIILLLGGLAALPLWLHGGLVNTRGGGDSPFLLVRLWQLVANLRAGVFPVRWMPDAAYGMGYPFFNFYAALPYYLAALFHFLGLDLIWALKLTQTIGFVLAGGAMALLARRLFRQPAAVFLAAIAYAYAPFHLVNVYVRGDSLSEFYAFIFYPLIVWALLRLRESPTMGNVALLGLTYGGLVLTHNVSALIFSPFVLCLALFFACWPVGKSRRTILTAMALGLLLGLALSAWFWGPALGEQSAIRLGVEDIQTQGYFHYTGHFRGLDLVQPTLLFDYEMGAGSTPFAMGLVQAAITAIALLTIVVGWIRQRRVDWLSALLVALLALATLLITPFSRPLWDRLPLLSFTQFPWRFLSVQSFFAALVIAHLGERIRFPRTAVVVAAVLLLLSAMLGLRPEFLPITRADLIPQRLMLYEVFTGNVGSTVRYEYLPRWTVPRPYVSAAFLNGGHKPPPVAISGELAGAELLSQRPTSEVWRVNVTSSQATLAFATLYFPGWQARVDGQPAVVKPVEGLGYVSVEVPHGEHEVRLWLGRTPLRAVSEAISALAGLWVIAMLVARWRPLLGGVRRALLGIGLGLAVIALLAGGLRYLPTADESDLTMDFARAPFLHHNPDGVRFGKTLRLRRYSLSAEEITAGETLEVTLEWDGGGDFRAEVQLVTPAEVLFEAGPPPLAQASAPLLATTNHRLTVPDDAPRGLALLSVRVFEGEREITPVDAQGHVLGTTYLRPVYITGGRRVSGEEPVLAEFDPVGVRLSAVQATPVEGALDLTLTWWAMQPIPANLAMSLRAMAADGARLAQHDLQPGYGFLPTSLWPPGELVTDRVRLPFPEGRSPDQAVTLEIVLYDRYSGTEFGTARTPLVERERVYAEPSMQTRADVNFGGVMRLLGYDLVQNDDELQLMLHWQALSPMATDYRVFVHLFEPATERIVTQFDGMPLNGAYPTSWWLPGEVVSDRITLSLAGVPAGDYRLGVGVYNPATVTRLEAVDAAGHPLPDNRLILPMNNPPAGSKPTGG
ncbi:MAG: 6-pyruvoyl-tetrahydropterin synthase-related protein [Anaerolineae bacterium]|nr:6-pyruvoyl-tetrahydropterin synthase-related protein [Anaerolineae bacterium]MDH7475279.1 6-pyruvoyl-tetrahydropterin synthase-related protein [Anaerolineae bacterium]